MAIFGFIVLVIVTGYFYYIAIGSAYLTLGFAGKIEWFSYVILLIAIILSILAYKNCPFSIVLN